MKETVWEPKEFTVYKTVFNTVCERIPLECTRTIYETKYRHENYTVKIPTCETKYRIEKYTVCRKVPETKYKTIRCTHRYAVHKTKYREESYTVCRHVPVKKIREVSYTVCRKVHETKYREETETHYKTVRETHYKDVTWKVCRPVTLRKEVEVDGGEWKTVKVACRTPVVPKCSGPTRPGCEKPAQVACAPRMVSKRVWVPKRVKKMVSCKTHVTEIKHKRVPYTVCRREPYCVKKRCPTPSAR